MVGFHVGVKAAKLGEQQDTLDLIDSFQFFNVF